MYAVAYGCCCRLSADEALAAGLVSRVVPPEQLMAEAHKIADKLSRCVCVCGGGGGSGEYAQCRGLGMWTGEVFVSHTRGGGQFISWTAP